MKIFKRFLAILLVACTLFGVCSVSASASVYQKSPVSGGYYLIQHVGSGKYWDITDGSTANGARLQICQRLPEHQNQVFYLKKIGNYWRIGAYGSRKIIEVRNSSKSNHAEVAQWDYANISCQWWTIICNSDGTVSFKNVNSGKYIDVTGNGTADGTKMIQYTSNGTTAQKFKLYRLYNNDILNATWTRNLKTSNISWKKINWTSPVANYTKYSKSGYYPTPGKTYLKKVEYIDADTVHDMLVKKGLNKSTFEQIKDIVYGEGTEEAAAALLKRMGYDIPSMGIALGILETLATSQSRKDWNNFANTTKSGKGIKKTTYVTFVKCSYYGPLNNGTTAWGTRYYVKEVYSYSYSVWNENGGATSPSGYSSSWEYTFK